MGSNQGAKYSQNKGSLAINYNTCHLKLRNKAKAELKEILKQIKMFLVTKIKE